MQKLTFLVSLIFPLFLSAQPQKGDLLIGLNMYGESMHFVRDDNRPGSQGSSLFSQPRLGYFFSDHTMVGVSPRFSTAHHESLDQFGDRSSSRRTGGELFFRQYLPAESIAGFRFFGEIAGRGIWNRNESTRMQLTSNSQLFEGHLRLGLSRRMARGLYFELIGEYQFFARSKRDSLLRYSTFRPGFPIHISGGLQIILEDNKYFERAMPKSRRGWKTIGGSLDSTPANRHVFGTFSRMKFLSERFLLGFGANFGLRDDGDNGWFQAGLGPSAKYLLPMTPRFGFVAAFDGRASASFPIFDGSESLRRNYLNATLSIGAQFFINQNLALEMTMKRPYFWRKEVESGYTLHSANWRVMRFGWELVYLFEREPGRSDAF